jgi:hypothetical protein
MKRFFVVLTICFCCFAARGQKTRIEQKTRLQQESPQATPGVVYPIKVHISGVHYRTEYVGGGLDKDVTYVDAIVDGKKVELQTNRYIHFQHYDLMLGDHQARLLEDSQKANNTLLFRGYELLLPDNIVWRCSVTGILE